jgi:two-component system sensor histidine kinase BaeS
LLDRLAAAYAPQAAARQITLAVSATSEAPDVLVDPERMAQVLGNLVSNALRHTPAGGRIDLSAQAQGSRVALVVADTGEGIPADALPHVFERFYRVDKSRSRAHGGAGLGLAIAKSIVEAHGGTITAASTPGHGTTFTITLPSGGV